MGGKRRRVRRGRRWVLRATVAIAPILAATIVVPGLGGSSEPVVECGAEACLEAQAIQPTKVASPRYLEASYVAPAEPTDATVGRLSIRRLRISAPVVGVGWDHETMSVPNDPATLGWFTPTARPDDLTGVSLIAGHVSDRVDRPGALAPLIGARIGDVIEWRGSSDQAILFRVVSINRYPRATGLPPSLFQVDGPHTLRLVTCTDREAGPNGIHYTDNLVVSAVAA